MGNRMPLPKAKVGDVVIGDIHPETGFVMFRVGFAYTRSKDFHWIYVSEDGKTKLNELWVEKVYRSK